MSDLIPSYNELLNRAAALEAALEDACKYTEGGKKVAPSPSTRVKIDEWRSILASVSPVPLAEDNDK